MFKIVVVSLAVGTTCFNTISEDVDQLLHCHYGHLDFNGLNTLQQKDMVVSLPKIIKPSKVWKECLNGKQQRDTFPKRSAWRAELPLQLIHSDPCGPIQPISNNNKRTSFLSLMIALERLGFICYMRNHKHSSSLKNLKPRLSVKWVCKLRAFGQIVEVNSPHQNSHVFVLKMG